MMNGENHRRANRDRNGGDPSQLDDDINIDIENDNDMPRSRSWTSLSSFGDVHRNRNHQSLISAAADQFLVELKGIVDGTTEATAVSRMIVPVEEEEMAKVKQMVDFVRKELEIGESDYKVNVLCYVESINDWAIVPLGMQLNKSARYQVAFEVKQPQNNGTGESGESAVEVTELREKIEQLKQTQGKKEAMLVECQNQLKNCQELCGNKEAMLAKIDGLIDSWEHKGIELGRSTAKAEELMEKIHKLDLEIRLPEESKIGLLFCAIKDKNVARVGELLVAGANANAIDEDDPSGWTDLARRAKRNRFAQHPINAKAANAESGGWTALTLAAKNGDAQIVRKLLEKGASVNKRGGHLNAAALIYAPKNGHKDVVEVLLEFHANVTVQDREGATALHCAAANSKIDLNSFQALVEMLANHGADLNVKDNSGKRPLHCAVQRKADTISIKAVAEVLINRGALVNAQDNLKKTPLHCAAANPNMKPSIVSFLLEKGANRCLKVRDSVGRTPLRWAAEFAKPGVVEALISAGANVKAISNSDGFNQSCLHYAVNNPNPDVMRILLEQLNDKCSPNELKKMVNRKTSYDSGSNTALHLAYEKDNREAIGLLEKYGADGTITNHGGKKPSEMHKKDKKRDRNLWLAGN